nr:CoA pyrophosphatase [uncultured Desulfuromonas sp.]
MDRIIRRLQSHQHQTLEDDQQKGRAAVALILRSTQQGLELLLIQRARHPQDPWSGNLGFPGGRIDPGDDSAYDAAVRETLEEVGLPLGKNNYVARLDDHHGVRIPVCVSCFVFTVEDSVVELEKNYEVAKAFWVPLAQLQDPRNHHLASVGWHGKTIEVPGIDLGDNLPVLWGLTYRFVRHFFEVIDQPLSHCPDTMTL